MKTEMPFLIPDLPLAIPFPDCRRPTTAPPDLQSVGGSRHSAAVSRHYSSLSLSSAAQKESGLPIPPSAPPTIDPFYDRLDTARQTLTFRASVPCTLSLALAHSQLARRSGGREGGRIWRKTYAGKSRLTLVYRSGFDFIQSAWSRTTLSGHGRESFLARVTLPS